MLKRNFKRWSKDFVRYSKFVFLASDLLFFNTAYFLALFIRFKTFNFPFSDGYLKLLLMGNILWLLLIGTFGTHRVFRFEPMEKNLIRSIKMFLTHFVLLVMLTYLTDFRELSRLMLVYYFILLLVISTSFKVAVLGFIKYLRRRGINHRNVAIVGYNRNAVDLYDMLLSDPSYGYDVQGFFTDESAEMTGDAVICGKLDEIEKWLEKGSIDELYVAVTTTNAGRIKKLINNCERNGVRVKIIPNFQKYTASHSVDINYYSHIPVLSIRKEPLSKLPNRMFKRLFDVIFALVVLVGLVSWLIPLMAILIRIDSKGPVIFKQKRSGIDGKEFMCYKLRTMIAGNEGRNSIGTQNNDPRITKFGKFLRRSRIDELPQFYNVLIGQMSVVGPRPHMIAHTETYSELINEFLIREYVKPGITGWAQTEGSLDADRKLKEMKEKVKNDIWYIENWSFLLDLKIIFNTTLKVFSGDENAK